MEYIIYKGAKFNKATFKKADADKFLEKTKQAEKLISEKKKQFAKDLIKIEEQKDKK